MSSIYQPSEDSFLLSDCIKDKLINSERNLKILEIGCGSGFQLKELKGIGFKNILGVDINKESIEYCNKKNLKCIKSNLFENISGKYDIILFNPPYLPLDEDEPTDSRKATTGGKNGSEIINKFLIESENYLKENGRIFLLTSNLTKGIKWMNWNKKIIKKKKLFFEELYVWEIWK